MSGQRIRVVRADDLLVCDLELDGLEVGGTGPTRELRKAPGAGPALLVLHLPPQHVTEAAFRDERGSSLAMVGSGEMPYVASRAAGPSRVSFAVPDAALPVPYRLEAILELLTGCKLSVAESAKEPPVFSGEGPWWPALVYYFNPPLLTEPGPSETAIELPFRLILSPNEIAGFTHVASPATDTATKRIELWHSRLGLIPGTEGAEDDAPRRPLRAIWMRQGNGAAWSPTQPGIPIPGGSRPEPFPVNAIEQSDRAAIVHLSGNRGFRKQTGADLDPSPIATRRLALSSLGAWLTSRGEWDSPALVSLSEWTHRATLGRDHFVRIVDKGFLYPFGHLAALIRITERKFVTGLPGDPGLLLQREFVVVRQPTREYAEGAAPPGLAYTMPLETLHIFTLTTPDLASNDRRCFLIRAKDTGEAVSFRLRGIDKDGNAIDLSSPLVFVNSQLAWDKDTLNAAKTHYENAPRRELDARGSDFAIARGKKGETTFPTDKLTFAAGHQPRPAPPVPPNDKQPGFWPHLVRARLHVPELDVLAHVRGPRSVTYHDVYKANGFGGENVAEVIAQLDAGEAALDLDFSRQGERAGALLQPSMDVRGLSRELGAVGGPVAKLQDIAHGTFNPKELFPGKAKLFGVFTLDQVLAILTGAPMSSLPRTVTERAGDGLRARHVWDPVPQSYPKSDSVFVVNGTTKMRLDVDVDARGASPKSDVSAFIENFQLHLLGGKTFIQIHFDRVEFKADTGTKPDVDVRMREVRFVGPLSFVEQLKQVIPLQGFSDPPALDVDAEGIRSSFSLSLPNLAVGVFALQNINLGAGFRIPFRESPLTVSFNFCRREEPFLLAVSVFGGGGFFALAIDPKGVQRLEAAFEFGATAAINLGVAQGGVHVMAGIYFKIESEQGATLSGYFRLGGYMSVLGLISASIELYLSLTYQDPGKALGRATITIEIEVFLFSTSVQVLCERKFAGRPNDPTFRDLMKPYKDPAGNLVRPWHDYCAAFA